MFAPACCRWSFDVCMQSQHYVFFLLAPGSLILTARFTLTTSQLRSPAPLQVTGILLMTRKLPSSCPSPAWHSGLSRLCSSSSGILRDYTWISSFCSIHYWVLPLLPFTTKVFLSRLYLFLSPPPSLQTTSPPEANTSTLNVRRRLLDNNSVFMGKRE